MYTFLRIEKQQKRRTHDQKRLQIIMNRVQSEYSLPLQIEKEFQTIVEKINSILLNKKISADAFVDLYLGHFPKDLKKNCRIWYFAGSAEKFTATETPGLSNHKKGLMARVFASLVELAKKDPSENAIKSNERFLAGVFGENSAPWYLATERKSRLTPVIFENRQHYLYWESFSENEDCSGGFIAIFPGSFIENNRYAFYRLAKNIQLEEKNVYPVFLCKKGLSRLYPPIIPSKNRLSPEVIHAIRTGTKSFNRIDGSFKPRSLTEMNNNRFYYDSIADETPYFAMLCLHDPGFKTETSSTFPVCLAGLIYLWSIFFWLRLADGKFKLEFAFRLLFFATAMLPVILLAFLGIRLIDQLYGSSVRTRVESGFAMFERTNNKAEEMISLSSGLIKEKFYDRLFQDIILSDSPEQIRTAFNFFAKSLKDSDISLRYLILIKPGKLPVYFADSYRDKVYAKHILNYYAPSCFSLHERIIAGLPGLASILLSPEQKSILKTYKTSERQMANIFKSSLETPSYLGETGSEKNLNLSFIITQKNLPAAYITLGFNLETAIEKIMLREFESTRISPDDFFIGLNIDMAKHKALFLEKNKRAFSSNKGKRLIEFMKSSRNFKFTIEFSDEQDYFIFDPLVKISSLSGGASLSLADLKNERELRLIMLGLLLTILSVIIYLLAAWVSQTIIEPTRELSSIFTDISAGNFSRNFSYSSENELGHLSKATNLMARGLQQRQILGKFVSRTFDQNVMAATDREEAQQLYGVILFSDIRSFTTISESNSPEVTSQMLNHHLQAMVEEIQSHNGKIEQFIGDAIVAFFPGEDRISAHNAIEAAASMMKKHLKITDLRRSNGLFAYGIGIGLEYGPVMAGTLKSGSRSEFSVVGPARTKAEEYEAATKAAHFTRILAGKSLVAILQDSPYSFCRHDENCFELRSLDKSS
ncbi:MAG: adenylate/guanylate cyclase domain-containing protein [Candidatus Riflebacteria bacterium]